MPGDASIGNSGVQIAFTDEIMPTPYPSPVPNYIHALQVSIDIWTKPAIQIMTPYLNDMLEAGNEYDYEIKLTTSVHNLGLPSVKRILPGTSEKFYAPKTLLSVSWKGISALVDPDERKVVQVWKENTNTNIKQ
ncbi:MAG TPA: hypothetical protein VF354_04575 [Candidatus Methanoperedens sp.]